MLCLSPGDSDSAEATKLSDMKVSQKHLTAQTCSRAGTDGYCLPVPPPMALKAMEISMWGFKTQCSHQNHILIRLVSKTTLSLFVFLCIYIFNKHPLFAEGN